MDKGMIAMVSVAITIVISILYATLLKRVISDARNRFCIWYLTLATISIVGFSIFRFLPASFQAAVVLLAVVCYGLLFVFIDELLSKKERR